MNKQEVIDKIEKEKSPFNSWEGLNRNNALDDALDIVEKLDEPEKPVVPQFVADFYESIKDDFEYKVYELCLQYKHRGDELPQGVAWWFGDSRNKPIETLVMMHKFGYEVEKKRGEVMFELYFQINDNEPELQSVFDTKAEAEKHMKRLIDSKSRIKSWYIREIRHDGYWLYDYGAHNAFYMVKEVEECNQKH